MNTTSQDAARAASATLRVIDLLVTKMVMTILPQPQPPRRCSSIGAACVPGYYHDAIPGSCSACPAGKFSAEYASSGCTPCPPGWDSPAGQSLCWPSAVNPCVRGPCPRNHCGRQCRPCGCPIDSYADTSPCAATGCIRCPMTPSQYTDDLGECRACADGFIFIFNGGCQRCPNGTYAIRGKECMNQCPPNFYRNTPSTCLECPSNSTALNGVCTAAAC